MRASVGWAGELVMGSAQEEESEPAGKRGNYPKKKVREEIKWFILSTKFLVRTFLSNLVSHFSNIELWFLKFKMIS